jgi:ABC-type Zn uptake system ZnuABC Zn-binding protein ZnuA
MKNRSIASLLPGNNHSGKTHLPVSWFLLVTLAVLVLGGLVPVPACAQKPAKEAVVCSVFPVFALASELTAGTSIAVSLLLPPNLGCPHHYSLTPGDLERVKKAELFFMTGLGFEPFSERLKKEFPHLREIDCSQGSIPLRDTDGEVNSHVFSHPAGLKRMVEVMGNELVKAFPGQATGVAAQMKRLNGELDAAIASFSQLAGEVSSLPVAVTHESLDYLTKDLGVNVAVRISFHADEGHEPSAGEVLRLSADLKRQKPRFILVEEGTADSIAELLSKENQIPLVVINTLVAGPEKVAPGYIAGVLSRNLQVLREHLQK